MKVSNELPNLPTWENVGFRALDLIASLPEEERTKEHATEKGETKKPDDLKLLIFF